MKIALFKCLSSDSTITVACNPDGAAWCDRHKGYVRLSEAADVDFIMIKDAYASVKSEALEHARVAAKKANDLVASLEGENNE